MEKTLTRVKTDFMLIKGSLLIDGNGGEPVRNAAILVQGDTIISIGTTESIAPPESGSFKEFNYEGKSILPGLVDCHVHLIGFGDGRSGDNLATLPDEILTLQAAGNAKRHLLSGVTTVRDCGAKNQTTFMLRKAVEMNVAISPRLILAGRPIAVEGGHLGYFGTTVTGVVEARRAVRQLLGEGADFIKITATDGSTKTSIKGRPSFNRDEISAIVDEAHKFGVHVAAHCLNSEGIINSLESGVDTIIHGYHLEPDGTFVYRSDISDAMVKNGTYLNPTLHQARQRLWDLKDREKSVGVSESAKREIIESERQWEERKPMFTRMLSDGVKFAAGTDASWMHYKLGGSSLQDEVLAHVDVGMTAMEAIVSATKDSARSCWVDSQVGTLEVGKKADILVVDGDPSTDIKSLRNIVDVFLGGKRIDRAST